MLAEFKKKYIGDRAFYSYVIGIAIPMILQNVVTNFVNLLDNIMVGQVGTDQMSGVAIVNQFMFVFNISVFGAVAGPGIFGTQFYGKNDIEGQRYTLRMRVLIGAVLMSAAMLIFGLFDTNLISLYLRSNSAPESLAATLAYGKSYMSIMLFTAIPFAAGQVYSSALRECEETKIPMIGSISAVGINLILDYILIFGKFGFPRLGVQGAAIATLVAKSVEAGVIIIWAHTHTNRIKCIKGLYRGFKIPWALSKRVIIKSLPLFFNEFLWAYGMTTVAQSYAIRGIEVVAAQNISGTMSNLFSVIYIQLGSAISIIVGQRLGAGKLKEAKDYDNKMIAFSLMVCLGVSIVMLPIAGVFPRLYNTEDNIRKLASFFIMVQACVMPLWSYSNSCYFTLRSGGNTIITFIFDSVFTWVIMIPLVYVLTRFTTLPIHTVYILVTSSEIIKVIMGYFMVKSDKWINTIVS